MKHDTQTFNVEDCTKEAIDLIKENFLAKTNVDFASDAPYVYNVYGSPEPPKIPGATWVWATSNKLMIQWSSRETMLSAWKKLGLI